MTQIQAKLSKLQIVPWRRGCQEPVVLRTRSTVLGWCRQHTVTVQVLVSLSTSLFLTVWSCSCCKGSLNVKTWQHSGISEWRPWAYSQGVLPLWVFLDGLLQFDNFRAQQDLGVCAHMYTQTRTLAYFSSPVWVGSTYRTVLAGSNLTDDQTENVATGVFMDDCVLFTQVSPHHWRAASHTYRHNEDTDALSKPLPLITPKLHRLWVTSDKLGNGARDGRAEDERWDLSQDEGMLLINNSINLR